MDAPTWLEACLFQKVLQKSEKDETIEVSSITVKPATIKGDNYASDMYRINVIFSQVVEGRKTSQRKSLVAKVAPQGDSREEMISDAGFFDVEMSMMSKTLPRMGQILQGKLNGISLSARCLHVQREKPIFLILEDLASKGFRMADRQAGLDLDHCLLAIRNLAAFHASSVALVEKDPEAVAEYQRGMFHEDHSSSMQIFFSAGTKSLGEEAAKWPELSPGVAEKILKLSDVVYEKACEAAAYKKDDFNVINHGDFWVNNMLFCYDEQQKPINHTFVDFQICHYASPAVDLLYFFGTSPSDKVRMHHRELILREYHTSLAETMTKLECSTEAPSFDDLKEILRLRALCEAIPSFTILPLVLVDKSEAKSLEEIMTLDGKYENPAYQVTMDAPTWLEASLFQKVLQESEKDETIEVSSITAKPALAKGDNYCSDMYRVNVIFSRVVKGQKTSETKSLIAKVAPQGNYWREMISNGGYFNVEMSMMSKTLPRMGQILQGKLDRTSLSARCLHVQREKPIFLILEDLASKGFRMADRQAGLDLDHCLLAIRNLAAFHASSIALVEKDPIAVAEYQRGIFHEDQPSAIRNFFSASTKSLGEEVAKWPELSPRIAEKILKLSDVIYEKACEIAACRKDDFNVINHGDFWVNNMLFCYDEQQKPIDHIFVDFQVCHYGSPAVDLLNFFGTSPSDKVRMHHRELILRKYHTSLVKIMTKLECITEAPSFDELEEILRKRALCEVISSFAALPVILLDKSEAKDFQEIMTPDGNYENFACQGKLYRDVMTRLLPYYDRMGLLEV